MRWRALHWYASLFRLAGGSLEQVAHKAGVVGAESVQQWVETPQLRYTRLPRGFRAVEAWLMARPHNPGLEDVWSHPRVQARLGTLYRGYRLDKRAQRPRFDDIHVARELSDVMYGRRKGPSHALKLAEALGTWRKAPIRHGLATEALHALVPLLAAWAASQEERPRGRSKGSRRVRAAAPS